MERALAGSTHAPKKGTKRTAKKDKYREDPPPPPVTPPAQSTSEPVRGGGDGDH